MKKVAVLLLLSSLHLICKAQGGIWTWVKGVDSVDALGNIGTLGVTNTANCPDGRYQAMNWIDQNGNFWIFGGVMNDAYSVHNDLWEYNPTANTWTWVNGPNTPNGSGVYGTQGIPAPGNVPGARGWGGVSWTDHQGHLWLHGGFGYDASGTYAALDDLWMYDIATNEWTWMQGSTVANTSPNYGTLGVAAPSNSPGSRDECNTAWVKSDGTLWTFGGEFNFNSNYNDMWKYDVSTNEWTWMSGTAGTTTAYSYGTLGVQLPSNLPPARGSYTRWQDANDNYYIFGGVDYEANIDYNDVWMYNTTNNEWTWIAGSDLTDNPGDYTSLCTPGGNAQPTGRVENRTAQMRGCTDAFWTFGGSNAGIGDTCFNDLWNFNTQTGQWTWVSGSSACNAVGNWGTIGVPAASNVPSARCGVCLWVDNNGKLWMWGGENQTARCYNDMWTFVADTACLHSTLFVNLTGHLSDSIICPGDSAHLSISGGTIISVGPAGISTITDSADVLLHPSSDTTYMVVAGGNCGVVDTLRYHITIGSVVSGFSQNVCHSYTFHGQVLTLPGTYIDTFTSVAGCDSIVTLTLSIIPVSHAAISQSICSNSSYNFHGQVLTTAGTYTDTLTSTAGCDSVVTLTLSIIPVSHTAISQSICSNSSYNFHEQVLTTAGNYTDTLTSAAGCDSIVTLTLGIIPVPLTAISQSICSNSSYNFHGQVLTSAGTYNDTLTSAAGCDSIVTLTLGIIPVSHTAISQSICSNSSYTFHGQVLHTAGIYTDTLTGVAGCDSIVTLTLAVIPVLTTHSDQVLCSGAAVIFGGQTITLAGTYADTLRAISGCDSIVTLTVTVADTSASAISQTICSNQTYTFGGQHLSVSGTYLDTFINAAGCDSFVRLTLTVLPTSATAISQTICSNTTYSFGGRTLSTSGIYADTLINAMGCDSIVTLTLGIIPVSHTAISQSICSNSSYTFHGQVLHTAGIYTDTLTGVAGCDSIVTLTLAVIPVLTTHSDQVLCSGAAVIFGGQTITLAGTYTDTLRAVSGCDSIVTLTVTVADTSASAISQTICSNQTYTFGGQHLSVSGTYLDTFINAAGCDSFVRLTLTVLPTSASVISDTICSGSSLQFGGHTVTLAGTYTDTLANAIGCDSFAILRLSLLPLPTAHFIITPDAIAYDLNDSITLTNQSLNADSILWLLNNEALQIGPGGQLALPDTGTYCIRLVAVSAADCTDTSTECIKVFDNAFFMPNAFTPNGDGVNDFISVYGEQAAMRYLHIRIFDRWGEKVFESNAIDFRWDGRYRGVLEEPDVFVYELEITFTTGKTIHDKGSITLIR